MGMDQVRPEIDQPGNGFLIKGISCPVTVGHTGRGKAVIRDHVIRILAVIPAGITGRSHDDLAVKILNQVFGVINKYIGSPIQNRRE